jgi:preprotein translocase subunit YajC
MLDLLIGTAWAQEAGAAAPPQGPPMLLFFGLIVGIWYFLVIRPQTKQARAHQTMVEALKKGDQVVTASGMHGRVTSVEEAIVQIEVAKGVKIRIDKNKVSRTVAAVSGAAEADNNEKK